jgi:hypothetical protein
MRKNKKYSKHLTKFRCQKRYWYILLISVMIASAIIGIMDKQWVVADYNAAEGQKTALINEIEVYPPISNPNKRFVLVETYKAGIDPEKIERLIGECENRNWDTEAKHLNKDGTLDRGLWMINDYHHKEVSNSCAFNLECSTKEAIKIIKEKGLKEWSCAKLLGIK